MANAQRASCHVHRAGAACRVLCCVQGAVLRAGCCAACWVLCWVLGARCWA